MKTRLGLIAVFTLLITISATLAALLFFRLNDTRQMPPPQLSAGIDKNGRPIPSPYERNEVKNTILKNVSGVQECYKQHLVRTPSVSDGAVKLDWQITPKGDVVRPEVVRDEMQDPVITQCLISQVEKWKFPPPPTNVPFYVSHTFRFKKENPKKTDSP